MSEVKLHLGDCLEYMQTMPDNSVDAVVTDPPYGISYQSARRIDKNARFGIIAGDDGVPTAWLHEAYRVTKTTGCLFTFCRWDTEHEFRLAIEAAGWTIQSQVIWDRGVHGLGDLKRQYAPMHDNAWFATRDKFEFPNTRPKSVYRVDRISGSELEHPTQKPLGLMGRIVLDLTVRGQTILDPFAGSGTTGVAALRHGRNAILCEIDPQYHRIAQRRISAEGAAAMLPGV